MIEPRPNCFSIDRMAASTALLRSLFFSGDVPLISAPRSVIATLLLAPVIDRRGAFAVATPEIGGAVARWRPPAS